MKVTESSWATVTFPIPQEGLVNGYLWVQHELKQFWIPVRYCFGERAVVAEAR